MEEPTNLSLSGTAAAITIVIIIKWTGVIGRFTPLVFLPVILKLPSLVRYQGLTGQNKLQLHP